LALCDHVGNAPTRNSTNKTSKIVPSMEKTPQLTIIGVVSKPSRPPRKNRSVDNSNAEKAFNETLPERRPSGRLLTPFPRRDIFFRDARLLQSSFLQAFPQHVLCAADGVLDLAFSLVLLAFHDALGVAEGSLAGADAMARPSTRALEICHPAGGDFSRHGDCANTEFLKKKIHGSTG
jgi:hypothetical protein